MIHFITYYLGELAHGSRGFRFGFRQRPCKETECYQCNLIDQDTEGNWVNYEISCQGSHFHPYSALDCVADSKFSINFLQGHRKVSNIGWAKN